MRATLILDFAGMTFYGGVIPNTPLIPDDRVDETCFLDEEDQELLEKDFIDSVNQTCDSLLDIADVDYFDLEKCKKLKSWLEDRLKKKHSSKIAENL